MNLGFKIQKANVGIRISILEIPYVPIFRQNGQLWIFGPKFAQKWVLGSNFLSLDSESASLRYYVYQFLDKTKNFEFLASNLPKNWFWSWNFKNLSLDLELASWDTMCTNFQAERKTLNFWAQTCCPKLDFGVGISKI